MGKVNASLNSFNRGEISRYSLARTDAEKTRLSAQEQINWMPTVLGPMMLRPGLGHVGGIRSDLTCRLLPFVFSNTDLALLELTNGQLRVWVLDGDTETLVTRAAVSTTVVNGSFGSSVGWTLTATGAGASASIPGDGTLRLSSPAKGGIAQAKRSCTVLVGDQNIEHAFRIVVLRGPVTFRAGSGDGADDFVSQTSLDTGTHSIAFTPTGATIYLQIETTEATTKIIDTIEIESAGAVSVPTNWAEADLSNIRYDQSGDVVFVACQGQRQQKIERRSATSWSVVDYKANDGPFQSANLTDITFIPGAISGNTTLTASRAVFKNSHIGCLFRLFSSNQVTSDSLAAVNTYGAPVRISGVGTDRSLVYTISGTWVGTITFQRSVESADSGFVDVTTHVANTTVTYTDTGFDNVVVWYRLGFKSTGYTSGTAVVSIATGQGGGAGICRVTSVSGSTVVAVETLVPFSSQTPTTNWSEGDWSDISGWPSSVAFHDGRLWWAGRDRIWGSVSDAYNSFDIDYVGDAGPINRSVGFGPVDTINWLLPLTRLVVGRQGAETSIRSSALDQPLTPTNFSLKDCSTQGSAAIGAIKIDTSGVFVQQSNRRVYQLGFSSDAQDYVAGDLTRFNPDIGIPGFVDLAAQRQPDTQLHFVRGDGLSAVLLHDAQDQVEAWWRIQTDGDIESVAVLPGELENRTYYSVKRTISGSTKRFIEKLARRDQCYGQPESRCADSHIIYSGVSTATITGLSHLEGESVVAWGYTTGATTGIDLGTYTVASGQITLSQAVTNACVGLGYSATFKSAKLAYAADLGTALTQKKKVNRIGLIMANTHYQGLEYGQDFDTMDNLPAIEDGATTAAGVIEDFDGPMMTLPGSWDTDARLCLRGTAPRPAMVMAAVIDVTTND